VHLEERWLPLFGGDGKLAKDLESLDPASNVDVIVVWGTSQAAGFNVVWGTSGVWGSSSPATESTKVAINGEN